MAKNTSKKAAKPQTAAEATGDAKTPKKPGRKPSTVRQKFELTKKGKETKLEDVKMASQAKGIIETLRAENGDALKADLIRRMPDFVKTKQSMDRILQHYRQRLVEDGFLTVVELPEEKKAA